MTTLDAAVAWIRQGFSPIPVPHRSKRPILNGWERLEITANAAPKYFSGDFQNIGVLLGDKFGSTDVDCDCTEAITAARELLPETGLIFGRRSKPFSHYLYRTDPPVRTQQFHDPLDHATLIELRGLPSDGSIGLQTVVPPSIHETGEPVRFEQGFDATPANIDAGVLVLAVRKLAAAALLSRHWPTKGSRHDGFLALAGVLARGEWSIDHAKVFHRVLYRCLWLSNPELDAADSEVQATFQKYSVGGEITGIRGALANMMHLAKKKVRQVNANDFDRDPWTLNTENGMVDLRTGALRPHRPEELLSRLIRIRYDPHAECPQFMAFLYRIMGSHSDASQGENDRAEQLVSYLQKVFGCAATGKPEKLLFVLYGEGNNGKTTLLEVIRDALGDKEYAGQVQVDSLMVRPKEAVSNNAVNTDLADLQGCRFVSSSEVEQGQRLSLSPVKYLTGLGQIKARRLRENMITFQPTYKLFLDCNHRPVITGPNDAIWNRVKCIPFNIQIPDAEIDKDLPPKLRTELPGILRWIVEGAVLYHRDGLGDPPDVTAATEQYRHESDRLKQFFEDRCVLALAGDGTSWRKDGCWVPVSDLYAAYASWAEATGNKYPLSKDSFDERLLKLGKKRDRVRPNSGRDAKQVRVWLGIRFRTAEDD